MKKIFWIIMALGLLATGTVAAQGPVVADKVVAVVGNSAILYSEVVETSQMLVQQRRQQGYTSDRDPMNEALEHLMLQKLLYHQAQLDSLKINTGSVASRAEEMVQDMIAERGSIRALEAYAHKSIHQIREDTKMRIEENAYAQTMREDVEGKVTITPGEVERYFKAIPKDSMPLIPEQYVYAQITRLPASTTEAKQRTRAELLALRERIIDGARFDVLARSYSVDPGSAMRGGELDPNKREGYVKPFGDAMARLKPGQISEVVETEYGFHLIQLIDKTGNLYHARHILLRPIFTDKELAETTHFLDSIVKLVRDGQITFEQAAAEHSSDKYSRLNGGIVSNHELLEMYNYMDPKLTSTKFFKEDLVHEGQPNREFYVISALKPGEVSDPFQTQDLRGNVLSKTIKLLEIIPTHPADLKKDYLRIEDAALDDKKEKEFTKWLNKKIDAMYIRIDPDFRDGEFDNKHWVK